MIMSAGFSISALLSETEEANHPVAVPVASGVRINVPNQRGGGHFGTARHGPTLRHGGTATTVPYAPCLVNTSLPTRAPRAAAKKSTSHGVSHGGAFPMPFHMKSMVVFSSSMRCHLAQMGCLKAYFAIFQIFKILTQSRKYSKLTAF